MPWRAPWAPSGRSVRPAPRASRPSRGLCWIFDQPLAKIASSIRRVMQVRFSFGSSCRAASHSEILDYAETRLVRALPPRRGQSAPVPWQGAGPAGCAPRSATTRRSRATSSRRTAWGIASSARLRDQRGRPSPQGHASDDTDWGGWGREDAARRRSGSWAGRDVRGWRVVVGPRAALRLNARAADGTPIFFRTPARRSTVSRWAPSAAASCSERTVSTSSRHERLQAR